MNFLCFLRQTFLVLWQGKIYSPERYFFGGLGTDTLPPKQKKLRNMLFRLAWLRMAPTPEERIRLFIELFPLDSTPILCRFTKEHPGRDTIEELLFFDLSTMAKKNDLNELDKIIPGFQQAVIDRIPFFEHSLLSQEISHEHFPEKKKRRI